MPAPSSTAWTSSMPPAPSVSREDGRARQFLDTLAGLLFALRRIEGRKEVILLSEGFYDDNVGRDVERVAAAAAQSYSTVYALDINRRESDIQEFSSLGAQRFTAIQSRVSPLGTLAAETDGELFTYASRRLDEVLGRIAVRSGSYYIVAFEPGEGEDCRSGGLPPRRSVDVPFRGTRQHAHRLHGPQRAHRRRPPAEHRRGAGSAVRHAGSAHRVHDLRAAGRYARRAAGRPEPRGRPACRLGTGEHVGRRHLRCPRRAHGTARRKRHRRHHAASNTVTRSHVRARDLPGAVPGATGQLPDARGRTRAGVGKLAAPTGASTSAPWAVRA